MGQRGTQDSASFFIEKFRGKKKEGKQKENNRKPQRSSPPLHISGAEIWALGVGFFFLFVCFVFIFFLFVCFSRLFFFPELFLKCTFYKVYQVFSYLKPNVNSSL